MMLGVSWGRKDSMRLTSKEVEAINDTFKEVFATGQIFLFGSRVDDTKRGGDIDLYIVTQVIKDLSQKKIDFLVKLKDKIGNQKIDIIISKDKNRPIEQQALKEGVILDNKTLKIQKYIHECQKHKLRIEKSSAKVKEIFPLSASKYEKLNDDEVEAIDQYLFRFAKLQDTLGQKLFKMVASEYVEDITLMPFLDILNLLEKVEILEVANWKRLRDIRNNISHQYDDDPQEMAEALNGVLAYRDELLGIFEKIEKFYGARGIK